LLDGAVLGSDLDKLQWVALLTGTVCSNASVSELTVVVAVDAVNPFVTPTVGDDLQGHRTR